MCSCGNFSKNEVCSSCLHSQSVEEKRQSKEQTKRRVQIEKAKVRNLEPKKGIAKVSEKRKEVNKEYFAMVEMFKEDNPECKAKIENICTRLTDDPHHMHGRGKYLLDVETWLPVCRSCHIYITDHPKEAIERGWSFSRLATQKEII